MQNCGDMMQQTTTHLLCIPLSLCQLCILPFSTLEIGSNRSMCHHLSSPPASCHYSHCNASLPSTVCNDDVQHTMMWFVWKGEWQNNPIWLLMLNVRKYFHLHIMPRYEKAVCLGAKCRMRLWNASSCEVWCIGESCRTSFLIWGDWHICSSLIMASESDQCTHMYSNHRVITCTRCV